MTWSKVPLVVALFAALLTCIIQATRVKSRRNHTTSRKSGTPQRRTTPGPEDVGLDKFVGTWMPASPSNREYISDQIEQVFAKQIQHKLADLFIVDWVRISSKDNISFNYEVSSLAFDFKSVKLDEEFSHQEDKQTKINHVFYIKGRSLFYELEAINDKGKIFSGSATRQFVQEMKLSQDAKKIDLTIKMGDILVFKCTYYDAGNVTLPPGKGKEPKENIGKIIGKTIQGVAVGAVDGTINGTVTVVTKIGEGFCFLLMLPFSIVLAIALRNVF